MLFRFLLLFFVPGTGFAAPVSFKADIAPILLNKCQSCHGPKKSKGDYRVDTYERAVKAGADEIHFRVSTDDEDEVMPPDADPLTAEQIQLFKRWQKEGARFDGKDPHSSLAEIIPGKQWAAPPQTYPRAIPITAIAFSEDGSRMYASGYREVTVWSAKDGSLLRRITGLPERIHSIDMVSEEKIAVAGGIPGRYGEVRVLTPGDSEVSLHRSDDLCFSAKFSPDGSKLATAGSDGTVRIFDTSTWKTIRTFANHSDWVNVVAWNSEGSKIASGSRDQTAKVFDIDTGKRISSYTKHTGSVYSVLFHPTRSEVYSAGGKGKLLAWRFPEATTIREFWTQEKPLFQIAALGTKDQMAVCSTGIFVQNLNDGKVIRNYEGGDSPVSLAVSDSANLIATGDTTGYIRVWDLGSGKEKLKFQAKP